MAPRVRLVTCRAMPEPDPDEELLVSAVREAGADAVMAAWDDPTVPWDDGTPAILRSPWNYHQDVDAFVAWADRVGERALKNPPAIVRWNSHKGYLVELQAKGIPVAPTAVVAKAHPRPVEDVLNEHRWKKVVIKPAVSAGSFLTRRFVADDVRGAQGHLDAVLAQRGDALVQEHLDSVEDYGERACVWIAGELTHAVRKTPRFAEDAESVSAAVPIADDMRDLAGRVLAPMKEQLLYARVDMARDASGAPVLMELEVMEPSLFLRQHEGALKRFASAITDWARWRP